MGRCVRLVLACLAGALLVPIAPVQAREVPGITITPKHLSETLRFTGPPDARPAPAIGDWNLETCKTATWCDAFPLSFDPGKPNGHRTLMRIEWGTDADYVARFYSKDGKELLAELSNVDRQGQTTKVSEQLYVDLQKDSYFFAVACKIGTCNGGYDFTVAVLYEQGYVPPPVVSTFTPTPSVTAQPSPTEAPTETAEPSPEPVLTPGKDGPARARLIQALPVSQQAKQPSNRMNTVTNLVLAFLLAGVLGGGGVVVAVRIRRDLRR